MLRLIYFVLKTTTSAIKSHQYGAARSAKEVIANLYTMQQT